ncbi:MAG TPA: sodium:proton antiporter [Ignavibacteriaceae bacterium]|nr:sodium:proton antiporter [Ignavibacteriaceae bacterium]
MSLSAAFAYINHRIIKLPFVIGLFLLSTILSLIVLSSKIWDVAHFSEIKSIIVHTDLSNIILKVMLGFLLFAGSLHTNWTDIKKQLKPISLLAVGGVIISTLVIALMLYEVCSLLGVSIDFIHCLIFGALISPTDPIAVLGILTKANVSKKIESIIVGESLFNDGIGVVVFIALLETLKLGNDKINFSHFGISFLQEAGGGIFFGLLLGYILYRLLESIDNYETEVLLTIAFVMLGYTLSSYFQLSGALAMVIMGLMVGNYNQNKAMSNTTLEYVSKFWELIDVILNAILFISIAFVLVVIDFRTIYIFIGLIAILIVLFSRVIIVYLPKLILPKSTNFNNREAKLIVWGGLRGGLSIALVLSLPKSEAKQILMIVTYICVVFSILVQGLTIEKIAKRLKINSTAHNIE